MVCRAQASSLTGQARLHAKAARLAGLLGVESDLQQAQRGQAAAIQCCHCCNAQSALDGQHPLALHAAAPPSCRQLLRLARSTEAEPKAAPTCSISRAAYSFSTPSGNFSMPRFLQNIHTGRAGGSHEGKRTGAARAPCHQTTGKLCQADQIDPHPASASPPHLKRCISCLTAG